MRILIPHPRHPPHPLPPRAESKLLLHAPGVFSPQILCVSLHGNQEASCTLFPWDTGWGGGVGRWETDEVPFSWDLSTLLLPPPGPPPLPKGPGPALFLRGQAACLDGLLGCGSPGVPRGPSSV